MSVASEARARCAEIAAEARHVNIVEDRVAAYAQSLGDPPPYPPPAVPHPQEPEPRAAMSLTLNAVNFGSGWFPTLRKRDGRSGYFTISLGISDHGPWTAQELVAITPAEVAEATGQDPAHELMALYAEHLRELGRRAAEAGGFLPIAERADLAEHLATWPTFADPPFYKRAQIAAFDVVCAGLAPPGAEGDLTIFADNLVPHVLRLDGVLEFEPSLVERIESEQLIEHGSPEEIEIRACALHAVELMTTVRDDLPAAAIDSLLWNRGQEPRYKAVPRHRARTTAY